MTNIAFFLLLFFPFTLSHTSPSRLLTESWGYEEHGKDWTGTCATGREQSPIDIHTRSTVCDETLMFDLYATSGVQGLTIFDTGETLKATTPHSSMAEYATDIAGVLAGYQSEQFHFHAPSEHRVNGKTYPLEVHFVHSKIQSFVDRGTSSRTHSVVGIFFEVDDSAQANPFIDALGLSSVTPAQSPVNVDLKTVLFDNLKDPVTYFTYEGSLTTPGCDEIVNWYVIDTPQKIKSSQLAAITERYAGNQAFAKGNGNNRDAQPLNGRIVKWGGANCEYHSDKYELSEGAIAGIVVGSVIFGSTIALAIFLIKKLLSSRLETKANPIPTTPDSVKTPKLVVEID